MAVSLLKMELQENVAFADLMIARDLFIEALKKYNPNQPRVPAGNSDGGQWTSGGGSGGVKPKPVSKRPFVNKIPDTEDEVFGGEGVQIAESGKITTDAKPASSGKVGSKPNVVPKKWANPDLRIYQKHVKKHQADFDAKNGREYVRKSQEFLKRARVERLPEIKYPNGGERGIYDPKTNTFGLYDKSGRTITYYKPSSHTYFQREIQNVVSRGGSVVNPLNIETDPSHPTGIYVDTPLHGSGGGKIPTGKVGDDDGIDM